VLGGRDELRLVAPEALHVTLVFLGNRPEDEVDRIGELVRGAAPGPPARLRPAGVKAVPPRRPRLFALDLDDDDGEAAALHSRLATVLAAESFYKPEKRPFWPHVTLARVRKGAAAPRAGRKEPPPDESFEAGQVTLYRSQLSSAGAHYEALLSVRLTG
jgi:2'-5' RNA ligase